MSGLPCEERDGAAHLRVRVQPRASRTGIAGLHGEALKVQLTAPPVEGKANQALVALLAKRLRLPKGAITVARGTTGRDKVVRIEGLPCAEIAARLGRVAE
ncbi:MAG: YggU family protein [Nitrospirae bacterium]|nr:MAG: YggU family protein [Nitrospirota bacterium]